MPLDVPDDAVALDIEVLEQVGPSSISTIMRVRVNAVVRGAFRGNTVEAVFPETSCHSLPNVGTRGIVVGTFAESENGRTVFVPLSQRGLSRWNELGVRTGRE